MAAFSVADVKTLREKTGAGMMDAKKALTEAGGDIEAAVDALRAKGLATAQKKSSRTAAEGLVGVAVEGTKGVGGRSEFGNRLRLPRTTSSRTSYARRPKPRWAWMVTMSKL